MAELKTKPTDTSVAALLGAIPDDSRRQDCFTVLSLMRDVTQCEPRVWGSTIIGFGTYHYKYASGREGDWFLTGFAPRKQDVTLYIMAGFDRYEALLSRLGKYKTGKSCLYVKRLADIDLAVLKDLVAASVAHMKRQYE
jgi:hypothetical protein